MSFHGTPNSSFACYGIQFNSTLSKVPAFMVPNKHESSETAATYVLQLINISKTHMRFTDHFVKALDFKHYKYNPLQHISYANSNLTYISKHGCRSGTQTFFLHFHSSPCLCLADERHG